MVGKSTQAQTRFSPPNMAAPFSLVTIPTTTLRERSGEIEISQASAPKMQRFFDDLIVTMYEANGIGIAATQIGKNMRIYVVGKKALPRRPKLSTGTIDPDQDLVLINASFERLSKKTDWDTEGCLSVPEVYGTVKRYRDIVIRGTDRHGNELEFEAHGFFARVIQHETDHTNGILFIDRAKDINTIDSEGADARLELVRGQAVYRLV